MTSLVLEMNLMKTQLLVRVTLGVQLSEGSQELQEEDPIINKNMLYQPALIAILKLLFMLEFQTEKF